MNRRIVSHFCALICLIGWSSTFADTVKFPTFGIAFTSPAQTSFSLTDSPGCVGLYLFDKTSSYPDAALCIEWVPANKKSADDLAQLMVKDHVAKIEPGAYKIGGEKAVKVSAEFRLNSFTHRTTYLVAHGNLGYMISAFNPDGADASKALDDLITTVAFAPPEPLIKNLDALAESPWTVFGTFSMSFPLYARKFDSTAALLNVGIHDLSAQKIAEPFGLDIEPIQIGKPVTFAAIQPVYSAGLQKQLSLPPDQAFKFQPVDGMPGLNVSNFVKATIKLPNGPSHVSSVRYCILELSPGNFVQFLFTISDVPDDQLKACTQLSDKMLSTVKVLPKKSP